jgi:hypothetical protein
LSIVQTDAHLLLLPLLLLLVLMMELLRVLLLHLLLLRVQRVQGHRVLLQKTQTWEPLGLLLLLLLLLPPVLPLRLLLPHCPARSSLPRTAVVCDDAFSEVSHP